jgi:hypothetical protein
MNSPQMPRHIVAHKLIRRTGARRGQSAGLLIGHRECQIDRRADHIPSGMGFAQRMGGADGWPATACDQPAPKSHAGERHGANVKPIYEATIAGCMRSSGTVSSNSTPATGNVRCPAPPNWRGMPFSIRRVPKLLGPRSVTGGPPLFNPPDNERLARRVLFPRQSNSAAALGQGAVLSGIGAEFS